MTDYALRYLSVLSYAQGFTLWHYRHKGLLTESVVSDFFAHATDMLAEGDMIMVSAVDGGTCLFVTKRGGVVRVGPDCPPMDAAIANATLIASAPDLLAALEQLTRFVVHIGFSPDVGSIKDALAAIARAKGETP